MALNERGVPPLLFLLCLSVPQLSGGGNTILYNFAKKIKETENYEEFTSGNCQCRRAQCTGWCLFDFLAPKLYFTADLVRISLGKGAQLKGF